MCTTGVPTRTSTRFTRSLLCLSQRGPQPKPGFPDFGAACERDVHLPIGTALEPREFMPTLWVARRAPLCICRARVKKDGDDRLGETLDVVDMSLKLFGLLLHCRQLASLGLEPVRDGSLREQ